MKSTDIMTPQQIISGMREKNRELSKSNDDLIDLAESMAQAKRDYAVAFSKKILDLKPAHPATLLLDIVRGDENIAKLRFEKDVAKEVYSACRQNIKNIHMGLETYRSILTWQRAELNAPNA